MKEKAMLEKWFDKPIIDWGGEVSPEYKIFQRNYKSVLREMAKQIEFELYSFSQTHYCFSAVMKSNITKQFYYISISDVRYFKNEWAENILYRTMKHDKDWTGGTNRYTTLENLSKNLLKLDKQILKDLKNSRQLINHIEPQKSTTEDFDLKYA